MSVEGDALAIRWACGSISGAVEEIPMTDSFRRAQSSPHIEILLDVAGKEEQFLQFIVSPSGDRGDARWAFSPFHGRHLRHVDWQGEWEARLESVAAGPLAQCRVSIPFKALGNTPMKGEQWRLAASWRAADGTVSHWPADHRRRPERFGVMAFR